MNHDIGNIPYKAGNELEPGNYTFVISGRPVLCEVKDNKVLQNVVNREELFTLLSDSVYQELTEEQVDILICEMLVRVDKIAK